jgi:hypothetical protein
MMEYWNGGELELWNDGTMEYWVGMIKNRYLKVSKDAKSRSTEPKEYQ